MRGGWRVVVEFLCSIIWMTMFIFCDSYIASLCLEMDGIIIAEKGLIELIRNIPTYNYVLDCLKTKFLSFEIMTGSWV